MSRRFAGVAAAALLSAGPLASCGGGSGGSAPSPPARASILHGSIRQADCSDWRRGPDSSRRATIVSLRAFYGSDVGSGTPGRPHGSGPVLPNQRAYTLFQNYCRLSFAGAFKLYKLYGRAAGFAGARDPNR